MSRSVEEWIGKTDDAAIPPRVRLRIFEAFGGVCQECGLKIAGKRWVCDHTVALINGGKNREQNLRPIHESCNKPKTARDVAIKSKNYRVRAKAAGIKLKRGRLIPGSRGSGFRKKMDGTVIREKDSEV